MIDITNLMIGDKVRLIRPLYDYKMEFTPKDIGKEYTVKKIIKKDNLEFVVISIGEMINGKKLVIDDYSISKFHFGCFEKVECEKVPKNQNNNQEKCKSNIGSCRDEMKRCATKYYTENKQFNTILEFCEIKVFEVFNKATIVAVRFPNNYVVVESSSCIKEDDYDKPLGIKLCMKRIEQKYLEHIAFEKCDDLSMWNSKVEWDNRVEFADNDKEKCSCDCCDCIGEEVCEDAVSKNQAKKTVESIINEFTSGKDANKVFNSIIKVFMSSDSKE